MREREKKRRERKRASPKYHYNIHTLNIDTTVRQSESNHLRITYPFKIPVLTTSLISSSVHLSLVNVSEGLLTSSLQYKYSVTADKHTPDIQ